MSKKDEIATLIETLYSEDMSVYKKNHAKISDYYGDKFKAYLSPYSEKAHNYDSKIMIVGQDWMHKAKFEAMTQEELDTISSGMNPELKTNRVLLKNLQEYFGLTWEEVYATNAFLHLKDTKTSTGYISVLDMRRHVSKYLIPQINIIQPEKVLIFGANASNQFREEVGINKSCTSYKHNDTLVFFMHHPASRKSNKEKNLQWKNAAQPYSSF